MHLYLCAYIRNSYFKQAGMGGTRTSQAVEAGRLQCLAGLRGQVARVPRGCLEGRAVHEAPLQAMTLFLYAAYHPADCKQPHYAQC